MGRLTVLEVWKLHTRCVRARATGSPVTMSAALQEVEAALGAELTRILSPVADELAEPEAAE